MKRNTEIRKEVKTLEASVRMHQTVVAIFEKQIDSLRKKCKHPFIWITEGPDCHCGWSVSKKCADCGQSLGCSTQHSDNTKANAGRKLIRNPELKDKQ